MADKIGGVTARTISRRIKEPLSRVQYALERCGVEPLGRAGIIRIFDESAVAECRECLGKLRPRKQS